MDGCGDVRGEVGKYAFLRFRKEFTADATPLRFDVSADERFELLLDGSPIRRSVVARRIDSGGAIYRSFCIPFGAGGALQSDGGWCILPPHLHMGGVIPPCTKHDKDKNENETRK